MAIELGPQDALIVVDVQNDFCPGGKLPIEAGAEVVPVLNAWIERARDAGAAVAASRDRHPPGHASFEDRGGDWPEHCVAGTQGAELHPDLRLPDLVEMVHKGQNPDFDQYSAFDRTGLAERLRARGVRRVVVGGLALDVCVRATVLDAIRAGFEAHLLTDATRSTSPEAGREALDEMRRAGAHFVTGG